LFGWPTLRLIAQASRSESDRRLKLEDPQQPSQGQV